jgi:hypothetical protein
MKNYIIVKLLKKQIMEDEVIEVMKDLSIEELEERVEFSAAPVPVEGLSIELSKCGSSIIF